MLASPSSMAASADVAVDSLSPLRVGHRREAATSPGRWASVDISYADIVEEILDDGDSDVGQ
jgi:hypothetical protein